MGTELSNEVMCNENQELIMKCLSFNKYKILIYIYSLFNKQKVIVKIIVFTH